MVVMWSIVIPLLGCGSMLLWLNNLIAWRYVVEDFGLGYVWVRFGIIDEFSDCYLFAPSKKWDVRAKICYCPVYLPCC